MCPLLDPCPISSYSHNTPQNVNFPEITSTCSKVSDFNFVLSGLYTDIFRTDVETCGSTTLPTEGDVVGTAGCYASISMFKTNKRDAEIPEQTIILGKLQSILTCL